MKKYLFLSLVALVILSTTGIALAQTTQTVATVTDQPPVGFFQFLLSKIGLATLPSNVVPLSVSLDQTAAVAGSGSTAGGVTATPAGSLTATDNSGVTVGGGVAVQPANACGNTLTPIGSVNQTIRCAQMPDGSYKWVAAGNLLNDGTNVGVGTTNPAGKLDVAGTLGAVRVSTDGTEIQMTRSGFNYLDAINGNGALSFGTGGGTNKMVINSAGNVGIGTANPTEKLEVNGNVKMGYQLVTQTATDQLPSLNVSCPSGKKVLGGGCNLVGNGTHISLLVSRPLNEDSWQCMWGDGASLPAKQAYAICANIR